MVEMWVFFTFVLILSVVATVLGLYIIWLKEENRKLFDQTLKLKGYVKVGDAWHITTKTMIEDAKQALGEERVKKIVEYAIRMYEQQEREGKVK